MSSTEPHDNRSNQQKEADARKARLEAEAEEYRQAAWAQEVSEFRAQPNQYAKQVRTDQLNEGNYHSRSIFYSGYTAWGR